MTERIEPTMSLTKRQLYEQEESASLEGALENVRHVGRVLNGIENSGELDMGELCRLCRLLSDVEQRLVEQLTEREEVAHR